MKKRFLLILIIILCVLCLFACNRVYKNDVDEEFGFSKEDFTIVKEYDDHGGFLGDGIYYAFLDCENNQDKINEIIDNYNELPLPENLSLILYGGDKGNTRYGSYFKPRDGEAFPTVEAGYYMVLDRNNGEIREITSDIIYHSSNNFTIAIYDSENKMMYYFEYDS